MLKVWDGHVHTAIFKMNNQQRPTVQHRELCPRLGGSLDGRGMQGRMDTCAWMTESLRFSPETITTLLIRYTPIQIKGFLKNDYFQPSINADSLGAGKCKRETCGAVLGLFLMCMRQSVAHTQRNRLLQQEPPNAEVIILGENFVQVI